MNKDQEIKTDRPVAAGDQAAVTIRNEVANELNNALGGLLTMIEVLLADRQASGVHEAMLVIRHEARRSANLAESLIGLDRIRAPKFEPLGLNGVTKRALKLLENDFAFHGIEPILDLDKLLPSVRGDYHQMLQALVNIIQLACSGASRGESTPPPEGTIAPRILEIASRLEVDRVILAFRLPAIETAAPSAFAETPEEELAPARRVVEAHGGELRIETLPESGMRIILSFAAMAPPTAGEVVSPVFGLNLLVVDDESSVRSSLARLLSTRGNRVTTASGAREALRILATDRFDLVLVDHSLPDLGGARLLQEARRVAATAFDGAIVMSGRSAEEIDANGEIFLHKPFTADELWTALRMALKRRKENHQ
jgi:CheY-like chemotaxis protein